jgi:hypothetical protein
LARHAKPSLPRRARLQTSTSSDGLSIIGLFGDGRLETASPATHQPLVFDVADGVVTGEAIVHFLVPPHRFWDDIHYT